MNTYSKKVFDEERALYGSNDITVDACSFDGPADGESALKESNNIIVRDSFFNLRYPFWHDDHLSIERSEMTENCRAAIWYSHYVSIKNSKLHGIKAVRECGDIDIEDCDIISPEFGWSVSRMAMNNTCVQSEYFMMRSDHLEFDNVTLKGKYSFQYIEDSTFTNCRFDTKDAFWHAKNVVVKDSIVKGEYLAWYCENVTFINCTIIGTQPLCYCKGLKLIDCRMEQTDLAFEKSDVNANILSYVESIKNPRSGRISVKGVGDLIIDDPLSGAEVIDSSAPVKLVCNY